MLVRDDFRGKALVNAIIDLPFALPTIVASIVLLSLYGPRSPIGLAPVRDPAGGDHRAAFVTLPFVVRSVQPVLMEVDREAEQAAASLGAGNWTIFRRIILPALYPALLGGAGLAFARAVGEFGSRRADRRRHPARDRGRLAVHRQADRDRPAGERRRGVGRAAAGLVRRAVRAPLA